MNLLPDPLPQPDKPVTLSDGYRGAIIGISITVTEPARLVYSLSKLCLIVEMQEKRREKECRKKIVDLIFRMESEHGHRAPIFVDDTGGIEKRRIISPFNGNHR